MNLHSIFQQRLSLDFDDIVFENRNKMYGAYFLRKHYKQQIGKALLLTFSFILLLALTMQLRGKFKNNGPVVPPEPLYDTLQFTNGEPEIMPSKKDNPPPVTTDESPDVIVADSTLNALPPELKDTTQSFASSTGTGGEVTGSAGTAASTGTGTGDRTETAGVMPGIGDEIIYNPPVMPSFPGGEKELKKYLSKHIHFTDPAEMAGASGKVWISFVVSKSGEIKSVEIVADQVGYGCAQLAMNAVKKMPRWNPGMQNDYPVNVKLVLPVVFSKE